MSYCHSIVATVKGAVVIDQIQDSELCCALYSLLLCYDIYIENTRPTTKHLNRYVMRYASNWYTIGIELGLEPGILDIIEKNHSQDGVTCFQKTLDNWLKLNTIDATWKILEVALTNVNRSNLGLDPVDDVYGKYVCSTMDVT